MIEYRGEIISQKLSLERMEGIYKNNKNFYFLEYEKGEVVDACQKGTNARFVNHRYVWFFFFVCAIEPTFEGDYVSCS